MMTPGELLSQHLRPGLLLHFAGDTGDGDLLDAFVIHRDQEAFAALVRRHGPMVLGVCRRLIGNTHDAEDAFQAVFLVLVRKADSIRPRDMVGNWLHGVALRTAVRARQQILQRRAKEKQVQSMHRPLHDEERNWDDLRPILDEELDRLPYGDRQLLLLCDLEGRSQRDVARQLKIPDSTLSNRLLAARRKLGSRLTRRGVTLSGGLLATLLSRNAASACVPAPLFDSLLQSANILAAGQVLTASVVSSEVAALTDGVLRSMFLSKLKTALAIVFLAGFTALGGGLYLPSLLAGGSSPAADPVADVTSPAGEDPPPAPKDRAGKPSPDKKEPKGEPSVEDQVRQRLKKHEDELARIRAAMLKECDDEMKKIDEAVKKAEKEMADAKGDIPARQKAFQAMSKARNDRLHIHLLRSEIERKIQFGIAPHKPALTEEQRLGIHTIGLGSTLVKQLKIEKDRGILLQRVDAGSPAFKAGLQADDILLQIDGKPVPANPIDFRKLLTSLKTGVPVEVVLLRQGKQETVKGLTLPAVEKSDKPETNPDKDRPAKDSKSSGS